MLNSIAIKEIKSKDVKSLSVAESAVASIFLDLEDIKTRFVAIGCKLKEILDFKYYIEFGYADIADFGFHVFGFSKSTTYSLININRLFCVGNELLPEYKDFSKSQLEEMSSLLFWQCAPITSDFTVSEIRDYKRALGSGGFEYKGINFKEPKKIINAYRADRELKKNVIPDVGIDKLNNEIIDNENNDIDINLREKLIEYFSTFKTIFDKDGKGLGVRVSPQTLADDVLDIMADFEKQK